MIITVEGVVLDDHKFKETGIAGTRVSCNQVVLFEINLFLFFACFRNYTTWNWTSFWHYKYGNCFVFNGGQVNGVPVDILRSNNRGPSEGVY